jgi:hypothetical protein
MSVVGLQLENLDKVIDSFREFPQETNEQLQETSIKVGDLLTVYARDEANHKWVHRFHNLEKDIGHRVLNKANTVILSFGLGFYPSATRVEWRGQRVSYGTILHEGDFNDPWIDETYEENETEVENMYNNDMSKLIKRLF